MKHRQSVRAMVKNPKAHIAVSETKIKSGEQEDSSNIKRDTPPGTEINSSSDTAEGNDPTTSD